ncbi:MAG: serine hydrolase domain-containing protein [Gemmatimonadota bacterium]
MPRAASLLLAALLLCSTRGWAQGFAAVDRAVLAGIRSQVYPGAVVVVGRRDTVLYAKGYGHLTWHRKSPRPDPARTLWDLASLTKVVGTASAVMVLADRGAIDLDEPVRRYLPRFTGAGRDDVTVRMLLDHTSGLPPYIPLRRYADTKDSAIAIVYGTPLQRAPGTSAVYSDLNAMLLGFLVESVAMDSFAAVVKREVLDPLGMRHTAFRPGSLAGLRIAPTGFHRGRPVQGVVNDDNALRLGGAAGHAGLFSTGSDLVKFAQAWLNGGATPTGRWVSDSIMRLFTLRGPKSGTRALGWDTPDADTTEPASFGSMLGPMAYGHTGWTGTQLWIDPARDLFVVFLTNRSLRHRTGRSLEEIKLVRGKLADAVVAATGGGT